MYSQFSRTESPHPQSLFDHNLPMCENPKIRSLLHMLFFYLSMWTKKPLWKKNLLRYFNTLNTQTYTF